MSNTAPDKTPPPAADAAEVAPPATSNKPLLAILGVNTLLLAALVVVPMVRPAPGAAHAPAPKPAESEAHGPEAREASEGSEASASGGPVRGPIVNLGSYTIRLRSADAERFGRFGFDAQMAKPSDADRVKDLMPVIRDRVIMVLAGKTVDDLSGPEGLEAIKVELKKNLNEIIPGQHVLGLFLNEFVIQ